ncbi:MAG: hypothetical protein ABI091_09270 [Ferruginibacter sp.]
MNYQEKMDKIFGKGSLWKHRTLRTLFDPYSSEYDLTEMGKKVEILQVIVDNKITLIKLIQEYKNFYFSENKKNVVDAVEDGLTNLLEKTLTKI